MTIKRNQQSSGMRAFAVYNIVPATIAFVGFCAICVYGFLFGDDRLAMILNTITMGSITIWIILRSIPVLRQAMIWLGEQKNPWSEVPHFVAVASIGVSGAYLTSLFNISPFSMFEHYSLFGLDESTGKICSWLFLVFALFVQMILPLSWAIWTIVKMRSVQR